MAAETTGARCHAVTEDGERCEREAGPDGFCYQHDESDETVDAYDPEMATDGDGSDGAEATEEDETAASETTGEVGDVRDVRGTVHSIAPELIGRELDGVIGVDATEDGWRAIVEVVERPAVPDSQDILGRYEIDLDDGSVSGYRRVDRYRRSDTAADEPS